MMLIKLGGSVITDKSTELTARPEVISRLAREIAESGKKAIIIHGGGSFGHIKAKKYLLKEGTGHPEYRQGIIDVQADMRHLNGLVVDAFHEAGLPVASLPAGAVAVFENGNLVQLPVDVFQHYLDIGITPISFGDVVVDRKKGITICSGDDIMLHFARKLAVEKCIFVTSEDGIYDHYPPSPGTGPIPEIRKGQEVEFTSMNTDVTGGMKRKLDLIYDIAATGCDVVVMNGLEPGRLLAALKGGGVPGTLIRGNGGD